MTSYNITGCVLQGDGSPAAAWAVRNRWAQVIRGSRTGPRAHSLHSRPPSASRSVTMAVPRRVVLCVAVLLTIGVNVDSDLSVPAPTQLSGLYQLPAAVKVMTLTEVTEPATATSFSGRPQVEGDLTDLSPAPRPSLKRPLRIRIRMRPKGPLPRVGVTSSRVAQGSRFKDKSDNTPRPKPGRIPIRKRIKVIKVRKNRRSEKVFPSKTVIPHGGSKDRLLTIQSSTKTSSLRAALQDNNGNIRTSSESSSLSPSAVLSKSTSRGKTTYASSKVPVSFLDALMDAPEMGHYREYPDSDPGNIGLIGLFQSHAYQAPEITANLRAIQTVITASGSPGRGIHREPDSSSGPNAHPVMSMIPQARAVSSTEPPSSLQFTIEPPPLSSGIGSSSPGITAVTSINDILQATEDPVHAAMTPSRGTTRGATRNSIRGPAQRTIRLSTSQPSLGSIRGTAKGPSTGSATDARSASHVQSADSSPRSPSRGSTASSITSGQSSRPLTIFFEDIHYNNKAVEPGFCQAYCGSETSGTPIIGRTGAHHADFIPSFGSL